MCTRKKCCNERVNKFSISKKYKGVVASGSESYAQKVLVRIKLGENNYEVCWMIAFYLYHFQCSLGFVINILIHIYEQNLKFGYQKQGLSVYSCEGYKGD